MPAVAHILHNWGGGSETHVNEICSRLSEQSYIIKPHTSETVRIYTLDRTVDQTIGSSELAVFLKHKDVKIVHIHQIIGHRLDFVALAKHIGSLLYVTLHDYLYLCPQLHLVSNKKYCGLPQKESECNSCIAGGTVVPTNVTIDVWRNKFLQFLQQADKVIAPTIDVYNRYKQWMPNVNYVVTPHDSYYIGNMSEVLLNNPSSTVTVAVLGTLTEIKGSQDIFKLVNDIRNNQLPIKIVLIGKTDAEIHEDQYFSQTGRYLDSDLDDIIKKVNPSVVLFCSKCPETYSYTLSAALRLKLPIVAPKLGSFVERLANRQNTKLYNRTEEILEVLLNLDKLDKESIEIDYSVVDYEFYNTRYLEPLNERS